MKTVEAHMKNTFHNIDRSEWIDFKFGELADNIVTKVQPTPEDSLKYIGLEHLDSGSIHIRRWGTDVDLKGDKIQMKKGDVIFGKRNAYLRRASVAPFDGICSAHAMVLRPKAEVIDSDFFSFFMNSDYFMDRAIMISVGSLSPTINWSTLTKETFRLPPLPIQKKLVKLLLAADEAEQQKIHLKSTLQKFKETMIDNLLTKGARHHKEFKKTKLGNIPKSWEVVRLGDHSHSIQYGFTESATKNNVGPKFLRITDIQDNGVDWGSVPYCKCDDVEKYRLGENDIVFARTGATTGKSYLIKNPPLAVFASYLIRVKVGEEFEPSFIYSFFQSSSYWRQIQSLSSGSAQGGFNASKLGNLQIVLPPRKEQVEIMAMLNQIDESIAQTNQSVLADQSLRQTIVNSIF